MKKIVFFLFMLFGVMIHANSQNLSFDAKYVKVGVLSNEWPTQWSQNPNLRNLGTCSVSFPEKNCKTDAQTIAQQLVQDKMGKIVLDILLERDYQGLHMDRLYEQALQNTTVEEIEVALQDVSAEVKDVLKKEISRQLLKNNYIVIFQTISKRKGNKIKTKKYWKVFHVDINDEIIEQVFLNWQNPTLYNLIEVPITFVAKGKTPGAKTSQVLNGLSDANVEREMLFDIAKKVPAFAIRGSVFNRTPFLARTTSLQSVKKGDRFYIYRFIENKSGEVYSKKVCTARATEVNSEMTRLYTISGRYASNKKGDVAVQRDRHKSSFSVMGQYSMGGDDPRYGGRLQYENLLNFSSKGIAQYLLAGVEYNRYKKEPEDVWWNGTENIQPTLQHVSLTLGYGLGFNFLGRFELMPYIMMGYQDSFMTSLAYGEVWNDKKECWEGFSGELEGGKLHSSFVGYAGARFNINLWYPVQLTMGADYNISTTPNNGFKPMVRQHELNRLNIYAGLRFHL